MSAETVCASLHGDHTLSASSFAYNGIYVVRVYVAYTVYAVCLYSVAAVG